MAALSAAAVDVMSYREAGSCGRPIQCIVIDLLALRCQSSGDVARLGGNDAGKLLDLLACSVWAGACSA
ncbi:MAG TPA: hypothetical protein VNA57_08925 [Acidimicrobiales bacterium]|nr:hypothetical protein [Acidimicrobiales bacterium]